MELTDHFTLDELTRSQTATRRGIPNHPNVAQINALKALCENVLEPLRAHFGASVMISSGFRAAAVNKAIGGAAGSQHTKGEAADFTIAGQTVETVFQFIRQSDLPFDQVIQEGTWIHVSHKAKGPNRREALRATFRQGKASYTKV